MTVRVVSQKVNIGAGGSGRHIRFDLRHSLPDGVDLAGGGVGHALEVAIDASGNAQQRGCEGDEPAARAGDADALKDGGRTVEIDGVRPVRRLIEIEGAGELHRLAGGEERGHLIRLDERIVGRAHGATVREARRGCNWRITSA